MNTAVPPKNIKIRSDQSRDLYWTRLTEPLRGKRIYICASNEYLAEYFHKWDFSDAEVESWVQQVLDDKWHEFLNMEQKIVMEVYAITPEGRENGFEFLKTDAVKQSV